MARKSIFRAPAPFRDFCACNTNVVVLTSERAGRLGGDEVLTKKLFEKKKHYFLLSCLSSRCLTKDWYTKRVLASCTSLQTGHVKLRFSVGLVVFLVIERD